MNFYSDINASGINDIVTYMEYYYFYPLENKTFRLLSGNVAGEIASCPTPTPTATSTPTPTMVPYNKIVDLNINDSISYSGSGTTVTDILGNTNASIIGSPSYQNDGCTSSIVLNGTSQYILTNTSINTLYDSTDTSIFLWVYLTDNGVILSEQGGGGLNFNWHDSQIELVNGTLKFTVWPYNGIITSSISTPLNNWYYIGFVYNNTTLTAYVNGQSAGSSTVVRQVPYENGHGLYYAIGAPDSTNLGDGSYSALKFGRLEIWDGAISSSDVLQNYNDSVTTWICPTPTPTPTSTPTPTPTVTPTPTPTVTSTPTPTPTITSTLLPVTGYGFNLVVLPYSFPTTGNTIMNQGVIQTGSTDPSMLATNGRGIYWNSIDSDGIDRTDYYSQFTGQTITVSMTQGLSTVIYSGDTSSFKLWDESPSSGFVFGTGIGLPPEGSPSGVATLIQSGTTWNVGEPVYISVSTNS
jgi:hypothetical protein